MWFLHHLPTSDEDDGLLLMWFLHHLPTLDEDDELLLMRFLHHLPTLDTDDELLLMWFLHHLPTLDTDDELLLMFNGQDTTVRFDPDADTPIGTASRFTLMHLNSTFDFHPAQTVYSAARFNSNEGPGPCRPRPTWSA